MKKLLFAFVALAAMSFASCGNAGTGASQDTIDTVAPVDTTAADTVVSTDTVAADTAAAAM